MKHYSDQQTELADAFGAAEDQMVTWSTCDAVPLHEGQAVTLWRITTKSREVVQIEGTVHEGCVEMETSYGPINVSIPVCYSSRRAALITALSMEDWGKNG